ncbi:assembly protein [Enterobacteria phage PRDpeacock]
MMGKGMEMMIASAIRAAGINPDELMEKANALVHNLNYQLDRFGNRLDSIDSRLDAIEKALNIAPANAPENQPELPGITFEGDANDQ